jgi:hypothetical protein
MNYKNIVAGLVLLASLVLSFVAFNKPATVVDEKGEPVVGAFSPYAQIPEMNLGGVRLVGRDIPLMTGSSTVCAIQSPVSTSTLVSGGARFTLASSTAQTVEIARNTTQYSTTTRIGSLYGIAASEQATIVASTTGSAAGEAGIFPPSTWFVIRMAGGPGTAEAIGNAPTGSCYAVWAQI